MLSALLLAATVVGQAAEPAITTASRPNIILCIADDQGWGDVAYNGHKVLKTPTLDSIAAAGLRFDRFYAAAPVCSPTRGSVLTGRHPNRFGCFSWGHTLRPQEVTLAEALKTAGYTTGHFGKWHLGGVNAESPVCPGAKGFDEWVSSPNFFDLNPRMSRKGRSIQTKGEGSQVIVDAALEFIQAAVGRKQPFLAVVWFGSPHNPYAALDEDRALYKDQPDLQQRYYGEITAMDRAVGHLRTELRRLGVADNTLLWYTSDNGATGPGSTGGLSGRKATLWEGGIRVPAIIEWPARIKSPMRTAVPCGTVDIYPTVLEAAGASVPHQPPLDGISLVPLFDGRMQARANPLGFWDYPRPGRGVRSDKILEEMARQQAGETGPVKPDAGKQDEGAITERFSDAVLPGHAAWIDNQYKLHRIADKAGQAKYALFDLAQDPTEKNDLGEGQPERLARMKSELEAWQKSVVRSLNGEDYPRR
jgi:arylsulfatase A-like enzyme